MSRLNTPTTIDAAPTALYPSRPVLMLRSIAGSQSAQQGCWQRRGTC
jgi:hypothetical protein